MNDTVCNSYLTFLNIMNIIEVYRDKLYDVCFMYKLFSKILLNEMCTGI